MKNRLEKNGPSVVVVGAGVVLVLIASFVLIYRGTMRLLDEDAAIARHHEATAALETVRTTMIDAETGQRGYVITGDPQFLAPYDAAIGRVEAALLRLEELVSENAAHSARLPELRRAIDEKLRIVRQIIDRHRDGGGERSAALVATGDGKRVMDEIRGILDGMALVEQQALEDRNERVRAVALRSHVEFLVVALLCTATVVIALNMVRRHERRRAQSEVALAEERRQRIACEVTSSERERQARISLERANILKDELLRNVSHELRTPLTTIVGQAELLYATYDGTPSEKAALVSIRQRAEKLRRLVDDLLRVGQAVSGGGVPPGELIPVLPLVRAAMASIEVEARARGVNVVVEADSDNPPVRIDPGRGRAAFGHVLDNAVKFSEPGGVVRIRVARRGRSARVTIRDEGRGITPEALQSAFEVFTQGDASTTRTRGGLGVGLYLTRFFVETYGGTIQVTSEGPGRGSTVSIELPLAKVEAPETAPIGVLVEET